MPSYSNNIFFVRYPSPKQWGSDFVYDNLRKYSQHTIHQQNVHQFKNQNNITDSIIFFYNAQMVRHLGFNWKNALKRLHKQGNKLIVGVRGRLSVNRYLKYQWDMVVVNVDPSIYSMVENENKCVIGAGIDPNLFKPAPKPEELTLCWVGRSHKKFKNYDLMKKFDYPQIFATYDNYIPHRNMPEFYNRANVYVLTSEHEGLGRGILEAASCGLAIVTSDVGIARQIVDDRCIIKGNPRANVKKYVEAIETFKDPDYRKYIGKVNSSRTLKFTWEKIVEKYDKVFKELL